MPAAELADALAGLPEPLPDLAMKAVDDELTLRLPTVGDEPHPSPQVGREPPAGKTALAAWRVPALVFEPAAAEPLLAALTEQHPELASGATLAYLAAVARFAADLAARGRVLPVLVADDDGYAARWRPVLAAADTQRARELAAAMPPLCRAADDAAAGTALADMLDALADSAARARLQAPLLPARRGRPPARIDMAERSSRGSHRPRRARRGGDAGRRGRGEVAGRCPGRLAGQRAAARRPGQDMLPPGGAARSRHR